MATFKPTKQATNTQKQTFKKTKYASYDYGTVKGLEYNNKTAYQTIQDFYKKMEGGNITDDDRNRFNTAIDTFINTGEQLRKLSGSTDNEWITLTDTLKKDRDQVNAFYSQSEPSQEWYEGYLKGGAFADGSWDFGDLTKTIFGTVADVGRNAVIAGVDATENLMDTLAYGVGTVGGLFNKQWQDSVGDFIAQDTFNVESTGNTIHDVLTLGLPNLITGNNIEGSSILDEKSDSLVQSGAHMVGSRLLTQVGVPAELTMGVNAFGSEIESAFSQGANWGEAGVSGAVSAGAEIISEKIFGGFKILKGNTISDRLKKVVSDKVGNSAARILLNFGIDATTEGAEEVFSEISSGIAQKLTYLNEKELSEIITSESLIDAFVGGAIMGGIGNVAQTGAGSLNANIYKGSEAELVGEALEVNPNSVLAQNLQNKLNAGKKINALDRYEMATETEATILNQDASKIKEAVKKRLADLGEKGNLDRKAQAIASQVVQGGMSIDEGVSRRFTKNYRQVMRELNPTDMTTSNWVKDIGTTKVNVEAYNSANIDTDVDTNVDVETTTPELANTRRDAVAEGAKNRMKTKGYSQETVDIIVENYDGEMSVEQYLNGFDEAYRYGMQGYKPTQLLDGDYTSKLPKVVAAEAYRLGKEYEAQIRASKVINVKKTEGGVKYGNVNVDTLSEDKRAQITQLDAIGKAMGVDIELFESPVDELGRHIGENGSYDPETRTIRIDVSAGMEGKGVMLYTASHELTHDMRENFPDQFKVFADSVMEGFASEGISVDALIGRKIDLLERAGRTKGKTEEEVMDLAYEEVIADAAESLLSDSKTLNELSQKIKAKDSTVWEKIKSFFDEVIKKIESFYKGLKPDSLEGRIVAEMGDNAKNIRKLWVEGIVASTEVSDKVAAELGVEIDTASESVSPTLMSERTWTESEYVVNRNAMAKKIASALNISERKAKKYIDDVNSIARMIANDRVRLDYQASSFGSAFVSNVEYGGSFDYTTLCKKRRLYTGTFSEIQKRLHDVALSPDEILTVRNMLIEAHKEATCGLCYVEGSRANMGKFAKKFIELYKRDNPDGWTPNMVDVNTPDGVEQMRINHPEAYEQYEYFWNHYGKLKDSDTALFASQQKPKLYEARKEYKGEILTHFKGETTIGKKNLNGGIRMQSFSDFEIIHLIDTMQVIMDMSTVGLAGQAYTKVPEFALAFGNTGLKINLSLIAKGVDENGKLIFDDREGMPHETAFDIRNKYSKNVGTIIVTFTDDQLMAAMADDRIDFIIPFHRSQWKKGQYGAMGLPKGTKDYTFMQNEKLIKQTYHEYRGRMVKDKATNYMPNEYWDFSKSGKENAEAYLKMCAENNKRPKFYKLLDYDGNGTYSLKKDGSTDGYWKLLIDFKMYDNNGKGSPQTPVVPNFNMEESTKMMEEYKGGHEKYPIAYDVVDKFVEQYNKENKTKYSDRTYLEAVERGDMETAQRMVDEAAEEAGYTDKAYHGTPHFGFTKFDAKMSDDMLSLFFTDDFWVASTYAGRDVYKPKRLSSVKSFTYEKGKIYTEQELMEAHNFVQSLYHVYGTTKVNVEKQTLTHAGTRYTAKQLLEMADSLSKKGIYEVYLNTNNLLEIDAMWSGWAGLHYPDGSGGRVTTRDIAKYAKEHGYNGVKVTNVYDWGGLNPPVTARMERNGEGDATIFIVFDSNQIKSADPVTYDDNGNIIPLSERFNTKESDIRYSDRTYVQEGNRAVMTQERLDYLIEDSGAGKRKDYANKWLAKISPKAYLDLTTGEYSREEFDKMGSEWDSKVNMSNYDYLGQLGKSLRQTPYLAIDIDSGKVVGHDGRHRMRALEMNGIESVEIYVEFRDIDGATVKYQPDGERWESQSRIVLANQFGTGLTAEAFDLIPLNEDHRTEIESVYGENATPQATVKYQDRLSPEEAFDNRTLLANALENVVQTDIEYKRLDDYKAVLGYLKAEETKLVDLNKQIYELTFGKGEKDANKLKELREEKRKTEARIDFHDKKLLQLEGTKALTNVVERARKQAYKTAMAKGREALHQNVEGRNKTQTVTKIKTITKDLNKLLNKGNKQRNVKKGAQGIVRAALDLVSPYLASDDDLIMNGIVTQASDNENLALAKYQKLYEEYHSYDDDVTNHKEERKAIRQEMNEVKSNLKELLVRERARINKLVAKDSMQALANAYGELKNAKEDYLRNAYRQEAHEMLSNLTDTIGDTLIADMSLEQLNQFYKALSMVKHMVTESNKIFRNGKAEELSTRINAVYGEVSQIDDFIHKGDLPEVIGNASKIINSFTWNNLRPVDAFEAIGSSHLNDLYWDVVKAQSVYARDVVESEGKVIDARKKYGYKKWDTEASKVFKSIDGRTFRLTLGEMMSLYAYSKRNQADLHLKEGGIQLKSRYKDDKGKMTTRQGQEITYKISEDLMAQITSSLTTEQRAYTDEVQKVLTEWGEKGNEASRILYGIDLFNEEIYFPLQSSSDYLPSVDTELGKITTTASLSNVGVSKPTKPGANNPIIVRAFDDVVLEHLDTMSKYHAYVVPINNLRRVLDGQATDTFENKLSVKALIEARLGKGAKEYLTKYITDLNGGVNIGDISNPTEAFFGKAKGAMVAANLSVWIQQPFAVIRSATEINPKYLIPCVKNGLKYDAKLYEEMKKYAPIAVIKEMGGFDIGSNKGFKEYFGYEEAKTSKAKVEKQMQDAFGVGAVYMDRLGWLTIWRAVKREVADTKKYEIGSEEFLNACGERFETVIAKTQVYDSVNARSAHMRSKSLGWKFMTSFMGEPTVVVGMAYTAGLNYYRAKRSGDTERINTASSRVKTTAIALILSQAMTSVAKSLIYAMRDDDEDKTYGEKYASALAGALKDDLNLANYFPIFRDIVSIWEGFTVERPDMSLFEDLINAVKKLTTGEDKTTEEKIEEGLNLAGAFGNLFGIPIKNIVRDIRGIINTILGIGKGYDSDFGEAFIDSFLNREKTKSESIYDAVMRKDTDRLNYYKSTYDTEGGYESALKKALRDNDPRVEEAAIARLEGDNDTYYRLMMDVIDEGKFDSTLVKEAFKAEYNYQKNK